jgi:Xaa-Pro aminopeptidase
MSKLYNSNNLKLFREALGAQNLDGFFVPLADPFQNEYIPDRDRYVEWLSNFQGSAGMLLVTKDHAVLFTDGRYTIQARIQMDPQIFSVDDISPGGISAWIAKNMPTRSVIGFDPWLHTVRQIETLNTHLKSQKITLNPITPNPLEALWTDRPTAPVVPAYAHPEEYAGQSSSDKRMAIAKALKSEKLEAIFLNAADSICWLLNVRGGDVPNTPVVLSYAFVYKDGTIDWFLDPTKVSPDLQETLGKDVRIHDLKTFEDFIPTKFSKRHTIGLDPTRTPLHVQQTFKVAHLYVHFQTDPCEFPKACKNTTEIDCMRKTHIRDGVAITTYLHWLTQQPIGNLTEISAANHLDTLRRRDPLLWDLSFSTISSIDANSAMPHYRPNNVPFKKDSIYLVDSGGQYKDGGTTDITRTVIIGGNPSPEHQEAYTRILKGKIALFQTKFPAGTSGAQLDALARQYLWQTGQDFDHGVGHGVGSFLNVHEGPQGISKYRNTTALQPGMVLSNEPGYYKAKEFGMRLENLMAVVPCTDATDRQFLQFENLTWAPYDPALVQQDMLTPAEKSWLHWYHQETLNKLSPLLEASTQEWLEGIAERFRV